MNFHKRSSLKELLDGDNIPFEDIRQNMYELNKVNTLLGGHNITLQGLKKLVQNHLEITICEIGCGGGDNLAVLAKWCKRQDVIAHFIGIDKKPECIEFASAANTFKAKWIVSDYRNVVFKRVPDIIFSSLFCHHFSEDQLITQVKWMKENSRIGFFINDLHRHWLAYTSIKLLTRFFSSSYLVKNDAPLSVARGFKKKEWISLLSKADLTGVRISWKWAFRYLITYSHG